MKKERNKKPQYACQKKQVSKRKIHQKNIRKQKRLTEGASMKRNKYIKKRTSKRRISVDKISKHQNDRSFKKRGK
jgi:uncharacterized protein YllA (UPF0747 family)